MTTVHEPGFGPARRALCMSLAAVLAAGGCMVGPDYTPPATTMPAAYDELTNAPTTAPAFATADAPAEIRWWRQLGDDGLTSLVERAVTANHGVAVAQARLREARAGRQMAQAMLYPQIGVGASALRYRLSESVVSLPGVNASDGLFQVGFDAAWAVDVFGGIRRGAEAAGSSNRREQRGATRRRADGRRRDGPRLPGLLGAQRELTIAVTTGRAAADARGHRNRTGKRTFIRSACCGANGSEATAAPSVLQQAAAVRPAPGALGRSRPRSSQTDDFSPYPRYRDAGGWHPIGSPACRPDIRAAERQLAAATAGVGVASAQLFPVASAVLQACQPNSGTVQRRLEILRRRSLHQLEPLRRRASQCGRQAQRSARGRRASGV